MMHSSVKHIIRLIWSWTLSVFLLTPSALQFVHDVILHHHHHEKCPGELDGSIHYHTVEFDCDYQPVFVSHYTTVKKDEVADHEEIEEIRNKSLQDQLIHTSSKRTIHVRGPPLAA